MNDISYNYYLKFDKNINRYLVFLVHVQQSEKIPATDQLKIFDYAKVISTRIVNQTRKYFSKLSEYNELERKVELENVFNDIINEIDREIKNNKVHIDEDKLFRLEDIIETLTLRNKNCYLSPMDINNLFYYKEFDKNKRIDEKSRRELEELGKKQDLALEEIKLQAFNELINKKNRENINPELFYKINKKILSEINIKDINYSDESIDETELKTGTYFIKNQKELSVIQKKEGLLIKYCINVIDMNTEFIIRIQGKIEIDEQEEIFGINEKYNNKQSGAVLNGYKLKELIEIFNKLFIEKYREKENTTAKKNKIDDYLSGRIIR